MEIIAKDILKKSVSYIDGIGETRTRHLNRLGIFTIEDMITHFPRGYEDRGNLKTISSIEDGEACTFRGCITSRVTESRLRRGLTLYKCIISDETGSITALWYNQEYVKRIFHTGENYVFFGKVSKRKNRLEIENPVYERENEDGMKNLGKIVPVYPATEKLTQNTIRATVGKALKLLEGNMEDILPLNLRSSYKLSEINYSIKNIHFPATEEDYKNAKYRLVFEELFVLQLALLSIKSTGEIESGIEFKPVDEMHGFISGLPFSLTNAQKKVWCEIEKDMESNSIMNRLVQGDVGSGKTIVAVLALFKAAKNGYQGTLMVPTEILAVQHYESIKPLLEPYNIKIAILTGSQTAKQKRAILEGLEAGTIDIVVGTHALIEDNVSFKKLGLVITDEQHRFGVRQRSKLMNKGGNPDVLVMTATPIPRTLALILYGDLDLSVIDELPPGRKPVETYAVDNSMRDRINKFIRKLVSEGRQAYIVCPLVEDSESIDAKSAEKTAEDIAESFKDLRVGLIHGKMKPKEKDTTMKSFVEGDIDILVSTTVIEVGVNVPNAALMLIENAERFGLAQLHQLRGRVGRGEHQSYCILYNQSKSDISKERMKIMSRTNDGFIISEEDLNLRGPGEFFGTRQHGIPDLKIANLYEDINILKIAQEAACEILKNDKALDNIENRKLKEHIFSRFNGKLDGLSLN